MRIRLLQRLLTITALAVGHHGASGQAPSRVVQSFTGDKVSWHGFDRFDFLMDAATQRVEPHKASASEGTGVHGGVEGHLRCVVVVPKDAAVGNPWSWRGRYFDHEPQVEIELLKRGFHIGFIQTDDIKHWDAWYSFLTRKHGLSKKPGFVGMSGGGRNSFTWATTYPDRVSCIYADNPLITRGSLMKLDALVDRDIPQLHVCGSLDPLSGNHTFPVESFYLQLGGRFSLMIKDGAGHHPHSLRDPAPIVNFMIRSLKPAKPAPAFVGTDFEKSSFYSIEDRYSRNPREEFHITSRGAEFSATYDQYEFKFPERTGKAIIIVPNETASGKPWVLRADRAPRDAVVDSALLEKGFHVVTAPRPRDPNVTLLQEWNALYEFLVSHGFSVTPVVEGAGGAAGEVYAWAIANPNKVSCIYGENPILQVHGAKKQPLDNLAPLAKADVPILHVCGSLDPWLESQTRVAEERYKKLGARISVTIEKGKGHYPLSPANPQAAVDFIVESMGRRESR